MFKKFFETGGHRKKKVEIKPKPGENYTTEEILNGVNRSEQRLQELKSELGRILATELPLEKKADLIQDLEKSFGVRIHDLEVLGNEKEGDGLTPEQIQQLLDLNKKLEVKRDNFFVKDQIDINESFIDKNQKDLNEDIILPKDENGNPIFPESKE